MSAPSNGGAIADPGVVECVQIVLGDDPQSIEEIATAIHLGPTRRAFKHRHIEMALNELYSSGKAAKWWPSMESHDNGDTPRWRR